MLWAIARATVGVLVGFVAGVLWSDACMSKRGYFWLERDGRWTIAENPRLREEKP